MPPLPTPSAEALLSAPPALAAAPVVVIFPAAPLLVHDPRPAFTAREGYEKDEPNENDRLNLKWFKLECPQFIKLTHPRKTVGHFNDLLELEYSPKLGARWKQQLIFQEIILDIHATADQRQDSNMQEIAERAATYIRKNYRNTITYDHIREALNFHPTYVFRCIFQNLSYFARKFFQEKGVHPKQYRHSYAK